MTSDKDHLIKTIAGSLSPARAEVILAGLRGSAPAYVLSRLLQEMAATFLVITADAESAEEVFRELCFYAGEKESILSFPSWDPAPFDPVSPHPEITGRRLNTLFQLTSGNVKAIVAPIAAVIQKVLPKQALGDVSQYLLPGEEAAREELLTKLVRLGYVSTPLVEDPGTFSIRGGILDIFPPNLPLPVRIEFFGDFVDTIRAFDPVTQRSLHALPELILLPPREVILPEEDAKAAFAARLKDRCDALGVPAARRRELLEALYNAIFPAGIEYLQPLFHPDLQTLFDYLGRDPIVALIDPAAIAAAEQSLREEAATAEQRAAARDVITCDSASLFISGEDLTELFSSRRQLAIPSLEIAQSEPRGITYRFTVEENRDLKLDFSPDSEAVLKPLVEKVTGWLQEQRRIVLACHQRAQAQRLYELLAHYTLPLSVSEREFPAEINRRDGKVQILTGEISRGFRLAEEGLIVIAEEEIFGKRVKRRGITETRKKQIITSLAELKPGDHMVHIDFGVAVYRGLEHISLNGGEGDFLLLNTPAGTSSTSRWTGSTWCSATSGPRGSNPLIASAGPHGKRPRPRRGKRSRRWRQSS